jgi:hypothetical protein
MHTVLSESICLRVVWEGLGQDVCPCDAGQATNQPASGELGPAAQADIQMTVVSASGQMHYLSADMKLKHWSHKHLLIHDPST